MKRIKLGVCFLSLTLILQLLVRNVEGFGQWYVITVYPVLVAVIGRFFGLFSFSVIEVVVYLGIILLLTYGVRNRKHPAHLFLNGFVVLAFIALSYTLNCGLNYYHQPFADYSGLDGKDSSVDELYQLCEYLTLQVNETAVDMPYQGDWNQQAVRAMQKVGETYPLLAGYYPNPKALVYSKVLSWQQISGIYSPFTIEANYNKDIVSYNIPHTICHELSHLKGFMREDEANFIGYLACIQSEQTTFQYSGYLSGWIYATNALARSDREAYRQLYERLDERVITDLSRNRVYWEQYEGMVAETATKINDTYLKMNQQSDGIRSYGRVVDLMLAYHRGEG